MQQVPFPSVLVVEDDPDLTELLCNALTAAYSVHCVGDGPDALEWLGERQPDVILLDCLLPGGGATEILARARELSCGVVLMSGLPEVLAQLADFGCPALQKPFKLAALLATLDAAVAGRAACCRGPMMGGTASGPSGCGVQG